MKKSLSLILAIAMVFSMFASVAFAAEATTTTTPKTTEEKYDALKALGIFEGDETGANLTGDMTRAQLAKIVTKLLKVSEDKAANTYTDVPADHWAAGFIGAATTAKAFDGVAPGKFDPEGKVSFQQLATVLVRLTGLAQSTDAVTGKVDEWAKGYVAAAVKELGLSQADYTVNANRGVFVELTFAALPKVVIPGKVSVTEAKATGVKTVEVKFNKAVDVAAAKLALTKGTAAVATTAKFSDDKTSAVLTLTDVKVGEGTYTVTLSGLAADTVGTTTASFTATAEKVEKLAFVNTSEKIAKSKAVTIKLSALNQYGEAASLTGGSYTAYVGSETKSVVRNEDTGLLELTINTKTKPGGTTEYQSEIDVIPVNVFLTNSSISAQKTLKVGTEPYVTKIGLGEVKYPGTKTSLSAQGDVAEIAIDRFDQYGDVIGENADLGARVDADAIINPYAFDSLLLDKAATTYDKLKFKLQKSVEKSENYTATVFVGAASATASIKADSTKIATKVEFGTMSGTIAEGDVDKYIPIVAYDAAGNKLSQEEIANNAKDNRFTLSISGATTANGNAAIVRVGEHKGKIKLDTINTTKGSVIYINLGIYTANVQTNVQTSFPVEEARKPATLKLDGSVPATKAIANGEVTIKWYVNDQYGEKLDKVSDKVVASDYNLDVTVTGDTYAAFSGLSKMNFNASEFGDFNKKELKLKAAAGGYGTTKLKAELKDKNGSVISKVEHSVQVIEAKDLTYSVDAVKDLFAALDNSNTPAADKELATTTKDSKFARKLAVSAKDKSGDKVAIPGSRIQSISSSNETVVKSVYADVTGGLGRDGFVIGNKAGTATALVIFKKDDNTTQDATVALTVKSDVIEVATITADASNEVAVGTGGITKAAYELMKKSNDLKVVDNYGYEYKNADIAKYRAFIGVSYVIENVVTTGGAKVSMNGDQVTIENGVTEFTIKAVSPSGKSAQTLVTVK